jgi:3-hydroxyisobutyrate dehydrogenase-like beta-hydroxyacid dehydrogenase
MTAITVLGLGEAGKIYAHDLRSAGAAVRAYDPFKDWRAEGLDQTDDLAEAVGGADAVLSLVGGPSALAVAGPALAAAAPGAVYADFNTTSPEVQQDIAALAAVAGIAMADVAVLAPVPRAGHRTELLASGDGAATLVALLTPFGVPVVAIDGVAGDAARLRLLRSGFMKGLAALVLEGLGSARAVGAEDWLRAQIAAELGGGGTELVERLVEGTHRHAVRREQEVRDVLAAMEAAGQPADMARATLAWFERIVAGRADA